MKSSIIYHSEKFPIYTLQL